MSMVEMPRLSMMDRLRGAVRALGGYGFTGSPGPLMPGVGATRVNDGWISCAWPMNYGQVGYDPAGGFYDDVAYAGISLYARTIAQLPGFHRRTEDHGGVTTVPNDALARLLKKPNPYQTRSDFLFNLVWQKFYTGNGIAVCQRNNRYEPVRLDLINSRISRPIIDAEGNIFYSIGGNPYLEPFLDPELGTSRWILPDEDVLHYRSYCPVDPLIGESVLQAAAVAIAIHMGVQLHFSAFNGNQAKPSGVIYTDQKMTAPQIKEMREAWKDATTGANQGGTPLLANGLKWQQTQMNATDAQTSDQVKQAIASIARVLGVPLALLNDITTTQTAGTNTEQLMMMWQRQGLGYELDAIELQFDKLFGIEQSNDYTEFDVEALLRPDWATRIAGLAKGVQGAVYSPNEARAREGLKRVANGDEPRVQQQLVPLDWTGFSETAPAPGPSANEDDGNAEPDDGNADTSEPAVPADTGSGKDYARFLLERAVARARA